MEGRSSYNILVMPPLLLLLLLLMMLVSSSVQQPGIFPPTTSSNLANSSSPTTSHPFADNNSSLANMTTNNNTDHVINNSSNGTTFPFNFNFTAVTTTTNRGNYSSGTTSFGPSSPSTYSSYGSGSVVRNYPWVIVLITLASAGILLVLVVEILVLVKTLSVPMSRRFNSMWLGQLLLFAIFASYLTLFAFLPYSSPTTCGIVRFCVGTCYGLCFSVLIVKLVVIYGSKRGDDVGAGYQAVLLLFVWAVQVVVDVQWMIATPPKTVASTWRSVPGEPWGMCDPGFTAHVQSLVYVMFLVALATVLALGTHGNRTNYSEGVYIGLAAGITVPIWIVWILLGFLEDDSAWHDPCIAFGLLTTATWILVVMFPPKLYHLSRMGSPDRIAELYGSSPAGHLPRTALDAIPSADVVARHRHHDDDDGMIGFEASMVFGAETLTTSRPPPHLANGSGNGIGVLHDVQPTSGLRSIEYNHDPRAPAGLHRHQNRNSPSARAHVSSSIDALYEPDVVFSNHHPIRWANKSQSEQGGGYYNNYTSRPYVSNPNYGVYIPRGRARNN